jgi:hypothetical protein
LVIMSENNDRLLPSLYTKKTAGAQVNRTEAGDWHLEIPAGPAGAYRLAQLDGYSHMLREKFPLQPPLTLTLQARSSADLLPGTWGFGMWNDPFSLSLGIGGGTRRFPALPNAAWFFFASPPNYLSLRDDLPALGSLAATFHSPRLPVPVLAPGALALPLLVIQPLARLFRKLARRVILQSAASLLIDPATWHTYRIEWQRDFSGFLVDEQTVLVTSLSPRGPLGLVLWIDNQYAALPPDGKISYGSLSNPGPAWIEIRNLTIT